MIFVSLEQLAVIVSGQLTQKSSAQIGRVSTDSRDINSGDLFLALVGEHFDGHDYVAQAQSLGAAAAIVSRPVSAAIPQIVVEDTLIALGKIGQWLKDQCEIQSVAITGSSGKTTVKELIAAVLSQQANVLATLGNFNNEIGVPLTLLRLSPNTDYGVFELGANHQGEIAYTSSLVKPDVALITNIGAAHLEGFGSEQGIAHAKSEIYSGLKQGGTAIFEASNPYASQWEQLLKDKSVLTWSIEGDTEADVQALAIQPQVDVCDFRLSIHQEQSVAVHLPMPGLHNVKNAVAAASACYALGLDIETIAKGLSAGVQVPGRLEQHQLNEQLLVIDDSYNANLGSTKAAIDVLAGNGLQQSVLVFGDMGELGDYAESHHAQVGDYAQQQGIDALFTFGPLSQHTQAAFMGEGANALELDELITQLTGWISKQNQPLRILIKGSRSSAMERVLARLQTWQSEQEEVSC